MSEEPRPFVPHSYEELTEVDDDRIVEALRHEGVHLGKVSFTTSCLRRWTDESSGKPPWPC